MVVVDDDEPLALDRDTVIPENHHHSHGEACAILLSVHFIRILSFVRASDLFA